jgi:serine/threonine protein kinase
MNKSEITQAPNSLSDEYNNRHYLADELARGGQGVVYRTRDADLAIKQPLDASSQPDKTADLRDRFQKIRCLPIPPRIPVSLPLAILRDEPGYVMRLLNGMKPFEVFEMDGRTKKELREAVEAGRLVLPKWLAAIPDRDLALRLHHYAATGSTRRRLFALSKCASILARLHYAGLVYGDISTKNVFIGNDDSREVWLIDADNMRPELPSGGASVFTPDYGAPEVVRGIDCSRPRSDCWGFAVMAFKTLALWHPFKGKKEQNPDVDRGAWDADPVMDVTPANLDELVAVGFLPYIDDKEDDSNCAITCPPLPLELAATPRLRPLFQETFGAGRMHPHRRPAMGIWALELAKACDLSLECLECKMSYSGDDNKKCPYCHALRPGFLRAKTHRWEVLIPEGITEFALPHRLFNPFSFEHNDDTEYEAIPDFSTKTVFPVRGTKSFPDNLTFEFVEGEI